VDVPVRAGVWSACAVDWRSSAGSPAPVGQGAVGELLGEQDGPGLLEPGGGGESGGGDLRPGEADGVGRPRSGEPAEVVAPRPAHCFVKSILAPPPSSVAPALPGFGVIVIV
jgi:hypothetical protein